LRTYNQPFCQAYGNANAPLSLDAGGVMILEPKINLFDEAYLIKLQYNWLTGKTSINRWTFIIDKGANRRIIKVKLNIPRD